MACKTYSLAEYLRGSVRNISIPDESLLSICSHTGIDPYIDYADTTEKDREVTLAWLYVWIAGSPTQSGGFTEEDGDWRSSENGERMSASVLKNYLAMANKIFAKYGLEKISPNKWGFVGTGFCKIRRYT